MRSTLVQFKDFYRNLQAADLNAMENIYAENVVFKDPVHELKGLVALQDYLGALCHNLNEYQIEYLDEVTTEDSAYIKWIMHFRHPKLGKKRITLCGVSHLQFRDTIYFHEDLYDMGAMLYEHLPLIGCVIRQLKGRLVK